jgi:uncharacterized SAM-binding protein YcdF (DUF218 family)
LILSSPPPQIRRQAPARQSGKKASKKSTSMSYKWWIRGGLAGVATVVALVAWAAIARQLAPTSNTKLTRFDAIVVLGTPADSDGNPTPAEQSVVSEAVREYDRGVAPHLIFTGAAVQNQFVEARVMANTAQAQGIPESAIWIEPEARNTIQNACYALRIMDAHGWNSAEVIGTASHLPRAGLILSRLPLAWRVHAAPPLQPESGLDGASNSVLETLKTGRYLLWASHTESCLP